MLKLLVEKDLAHLERIVRQAPHGPLPLAYWRARVDALKSPALTPAVRSRIERLKRALHVLETEETAPNRNAA